MSFGPGPSRWAKAAKGVATGSYVFPGSPEGLASGQWLVAEAGSGAREAVRIKEIHKQESRFALILEESPSGSLERLYGPFGERLKPQGEQHQCDAAKRNPGSACDGQLFIPRASGPPGGP